MYLIFWSMIPVLRICLVYSILCLDWVLNMQYFVWYSLIPLKLTMRYVSLVVDILFTCSYAGNSFTTWQDFFLHNYGNIWKHRIWILDNFDILIDIDFCENNITENVKWLWVYLVSSAQAFFYYSIWWNWARPSIRLDV